MPFDLNAWLDDLAAEGALTPEQRASTAAALGNEKVLRRLEEGQLRQSDYSRNMNELKKKETETTQLSTQLQQWKNNADQKIAELNSQLENRDMTVAQFQAKMKRIADQAENYGIDLKDLGVSPEEISKTVATVVPQPDKFDARVGAIETSLREAARYYPLLPAELADLKDDHLALFGEPLRTRPLMEKLLTEAEAGRAVNVRKLWEQEFKVEDKRKQVQESEIQKRIDSEVKKQVTQFQSENHLPGQRPASLRSPVLAAFDHSKKSDAMSAVDKAVNAFNEGKYAAENTA